jgi:hypothetical protein
MASSREAELERRARLVAARESELHAHRSLRRLWWASQFAPFTVIELGGAVLIVIAVGLLHGRAATFVTCLGLVAVMAACIARLAGAGRPR